MANIAQSSIGINVSNFLSSIISLFALLFPLLGFAGIFKHGHASTHNLLHCLEIYRHIQSLSGHDGFPHRLANIQQGLLTASHIWKELSGPKLTTVLSLNAVTYSPPNLGNTLTPSFPPLHMESITPVNWSSNLPEPCTLSIASDYSSGWLSCSRDFPASTWALGKMEVLHFNPSMAFHLPKINHILPGWPRFCPPPSAHGLLLQTLYSAVPLALVLSLECASSILCHIKGFAPVVPFV